MTCIRDIVDKGQLEREFNSIRKVFKGLSKDEKPLRIEWGTREAMWEPTYIVTNFPPNHKFHDNQISGREVVVDGFPYMDMFRDFRLFNGLTIKEFDDFLVRLVPLFYALEKMHAEKKMGGVGSGMKNIKDLKQVIRINAYGNKIELWKLDNAINSFEAELWKLHDLGLADADTIKLILGEPIGLQKVFVKKEAGDEFTTKVALEIYKHNLDKKPIWFTKLVEIFKDRTKVAHAIDWLSDWLIIQGEYEETEKNHAGYCYRITEHAETMLKETHAQRGRARRPKKTGGD